jgi:hypothetical protein
MSGREPQGSSERFEALRLTQQELERRGYYYYPAEKEHVEGLVTDPLILRIRTQIKKRGFEKVAGKVIITFSGYAQDEREIFAIPEIRAYWRKLDANFPELPAVLAYLPQFGFNGPVNHLMLLGTIDEVLDRPALGGYDVYVKDATPIIDQSVRRIRQAANNYRMSPTSTNQLIDQFRRGLARRLGGGRDA